MTRPLGRFLKAQDPIYAQVVQELTLGRKTNHWIWFIFPQIQGLGQSDIARYYAIDSLQEAAYYWANPTLKQRLIECTELVMSHSTLTTEQILGVVDAQKFKSCMTLFLQVAGRKSVFQQAIWTKCGGQVDLQTIQRM